MRRRRIAGALAAAVLASACGRVGRNSGKMLPSQVSLEVSSPEAGVSSALAPRLAAMGVRSLFVPAVRATAAGSSARFEKLPPPAAPYPLPVYVEVAGVGDFDEYFRARKGKAADEIWQAVAAALESPGYGNVQGLHLALRVAHSPEEYADVLAKLRRRLKRSQTLSAGLFTSLDPETLKPWAAVRRKVDFLVPVIFGRIADAGPEGFRATADLSQLSGWDVPLVPLLAPQGWGILKSARGVPAPPISDLRLNELSEDRRFDFRFGAVLSDVDEDEYVFTAKQAVSDPPWGGEGVAEGDSVTFRERRVSDLTAALSAVRTAGAKIIHLDTLDDQDHLIGFSVVEDVLLGKPLAPRLALSRSGRPGQATFMAVNSAAEFSQPSRIGNWIDLRLSDATIGDVRPGDFDRYEFLDTEGNRVPSGRARIIRFYENFVAPGESLTAGPIRYTGSARFFGSTHLTLPDGSVVTTPEAEITSIPEPEPSGGSAEPGSGGRQRPPRR